MERRVHGHTRNEATDELFFGPHLAMWRAALKDPRPGAQWTGLTTRIAELEAGSGWGLALPAELNGRPGPAHLLELKEALGLSPEQVAAIVMGEFGVPWLRLRLCKPGAVAAARDVGVLIERGERS